MRWAREEAGRFGEILLLIAPSVAIVAWGTTRTGAWWLLLALALAAWGAAGGSLAPLRRLHLGLFTFLTASALWTVFVVLPLPLAVVDLLSPAAASLVAEGPPGGAPPTWATIHQSPGEGRFRAIQAIVLLALGAAAASRAEVAGFGRRARFAVALAGLLGVLLGVVHTAVGERKLFAVWAPLSDSRETWLVPLVNENHWAAWVAMVAVVTAGLILDRGIHRRLPALLVGLAVLECGLVLVTNSRSGLVGLAVSVCVLALVGRRLAEGSKRNPLRLALLAVAGAVTTLSALGVRRATKGSVDLWTGQTLSAWDGEPRTSLLADAWAVLGTAPWTGVGEGAFAWARARHAAFHGTTLPIYVESMPMQWLVDYGLPVGALLIVSLLWVLKDTFVCALRSTRRLGVAAALFGLAVHDLADFSSEAGAVASVAVLLAVVGLRPAGGLRADDDDPPLVSPAVMACAAVGILLIAQGDHRHLRHCLDRELPQGEERRAHRLIDAEAFGRREWAHHPSAYLLGESIGAELVLEGSAVAALAWLNDAQGAAPGAPGPHLWTARALWALGVRDQALGEYGIAIRLSREDRGFALIGEVRTRAEGVDELLRLVPADDGERIGQLGWLLHLHDDPRALDVLRRAWQLAPESPVVRVGRAVERSYAGDREAAGRLAASALRAKDVPTQYRATLVQVLLGSLPEADARASLEHTLQRGGRDLQEIWMGIARLDRQSGRAADARLALRRARAGGSPSLVARSLIEESALEAELGQEDLGLGLAERAVAVDATLPQAWANLAERRLEIGDRSGALHAIDWALRLAPGYLAFESLRTKILQHQGT